jgi:hypothetical protein
MCSTQSPVKTSAHAPQTAIPVPMCSKYFTLADEKSCGLAVSGLAHLSWSSRSAMIRLNKQVANLHVNSSILFWVIWPEFRLVGKTAGLPVALCVPGSWYRLMVCSILRPATIKTILYRGEKGGIKPLFYEDSVSFFRGEKGIQGTVAG